MQLIHNIKERSWDGQHFLEGWTIYTAISKNLASFGATGPIIALF
jgi:hypothetical protein